MADIGLSGSGLGIASLALQLGDSIIRLKGFWDAVKEAPEEIKHLIQEIEILSSVFSGFETTDPDHPEPEIEDEARSKCVQFCRKAVNILNDVVKEVEVEIRKRRMLGSVKAALKKAEITRLSERLRTAQTMLMLCSQSYLVELQKFNRQAHHDWAKAHQNDLQQLRVTVTHSTETILSATISQKTIQRVSTNLERASPSHAGFSSTKEAAYKGIDLGKRYTKQKAKLRLRFQISKWLYGVTRAIEIYDSPVGWDFYIRIYNVIPQNAPIFSMTENGDIAGIQQLFSLEKASPFDRSFDGQTLLDRAARSGQLEVCRFLRNQGADPNVSHWGSAVIAACIGIFDPTNPNSFPDLDIVQLFAKDVEIMDPFDASYIGTGHVKFWMNFAGNVETLAWVLQASNSTYKQRNLDEIIPFILGISDAPHHPDISGLVRTVLGDRNLNETICCAKTRMYKSLLHNAARNLGEIRSEVFHRPGVKLDDLLLYITDLVKADSELHALTLSGRTPMLELLDGYMLWSPFLHSRYLASTGFAKVAPPSPLKIWLSQLQKSGIDLAKYGREEERVFRSNNVHREWESSWFDDDEDVLHEAGDDIWDSSFASREKRVLRLINFTYGPEIKDWGIWFAPVMEEYFMDFWGMIAHPERAMPGAWEEGRYDEDQY